jgi:ketosteroid isomerase-like protein
MPEQSSAHADADNKADIRRVLENWASATRCGKQDDVLAGHRPDVLIYDVLAPMKYEGAKAYRASWNEWQPETASEGMFDLEDLMITAGSDVAFAHAFIRCGGAMPNGNTFEDIVRATFCLTYETGRWMVSHQHISKPIQMG